jgi:hypothetical protein
VEQVALNRHAKLKRAKVKALRQIAAGLSKNPFAI